MGPHFGRPALSFLRALKRNNNREWFEARRDVYERELKRPMLAVIEGVTEAMLDFAPAHVRPAAKSMLRIYRDTRFAADKSPYKTQVAAWWARSGLEKTSGAGYYFHVSSEEVVIAAGVFMPTPGQLFAIRTYLLEQHAELRRLLEAAELRRAMELREGKSLKRPPKGFSADHVAVDLIKQQQYGVAATLPPEVVLGEQLTKEIVSRFRAATPLVEFLNAPLGGRSARKRMLFPLP